LLKYAGVSLAFQTQSSLRDYNTAYKVSQGTKKSNYCEKFLKGHYFCIRHHVIIRGFSFAGDDLLYFNGDVVQQVTRYIPGRCFLYGSMHFLIPNQSDAEAGSCATSPMLQ
jgi:hypothetical protein